MALNSLTLSISSGVQYKRFAAAISGLTTGKLEILSESAPGFYVANGKLYNEGLPYPLSTVVLREFEPGVGAGFRDTRLEINGATPGEISTIALAAMGAGRTLTRYHAAGTILPDGSLEYKVYAEDDLGAVASLELGAPTINLPGAPTIVSIEPGDGAATIYITAGSAGDFPVASHHLYGKASPGVAKTDPIGAPFAGTVTTASDLTNGAFFFRAAAIDSMGNVGPLSNEVPVIIGLAVVYSAEADEFSIVNSPVGATIAWYHEDGTLIAGETGTLLAGSNVPAGGIVYAEVDAFTTNLATRVPASQDPLYEVDFSALPDNTYLCGERHDYTGSPANLLGPYVELPDTSPAFLQVNYVNLSTDGGSGLQYCNFRTQSGALQRFDAAANDDRSAKLYQGTMPTEDGYDAYWLLDFDLLDSAGQLYSLALAMRRNTSDLSPEGLWLWIFNDGINIVKMPEFSQQGLSYGETKTGLILVRASVNFTAGTVRFFYNGVEHNTIGLYTQGTGASLATLYGSAMDYADGWLPGFGAKFNYASVDRPTLNVDACQKFAVADISTAVVSAPVFNGYYALSDTLELRGEVTYSGTIDDIRYMLLKSNGQVVGQATLETNGDGTATFAVPMPHSAAGLTNLIFIAADATALDNPTVVSAPDVPGTIPINVLDEALFGLNTDALYGSSTATNIMHNFAANYGGGVQFTDEGVPFDLNGGLVYFIADYPWAPDGAYFYGDYDIAFTPGNQVTLYQEGLSKINYSDIDALNGTATVTLTFEPQEGNRSVVFSQVPADPADFYFRITKAGISDAEKARTVILPARTFNAPFGPLRWMALLNNNYEAGQALITVTEVYPDDVLTLRGVAPYEYTEAAHHFAPPVNILTDQAIHEGHAPYINPAWRWHPDVIRSVRDRVLSETSISYWGNPNEMWNYRFQQYGALIPGRAVPRFTSGSRDLVEGEFIKGQTSGIVQMVLKQRVLTGSTAGGDAAGWIVVHDHGPIDADRFVEGETFDLCDSEGFVLEADIATCTLGTEEEDHIRFARIVSWYLALLHEPEGAAQKIIPMIEWHDAAPWEVWEEIYEEEANWQYFPWPMSAPYGPALWIRRDNVEYLTQEQKELVFDADKTDWIAALKQAMRDGIADIIDGKPGEDGFKGRAEKCARYWTSKGLCANQAPFGSYESSPQGESGANEGDAVFAMTFVNGVRTAGAPTIDMYLRGPDSGFGLRIGEVVVDSGDFTTGDAVGGITARIQNLQPSWATSRKPNSGELLDLVDADGDILETGILEAADGHSLFYETCDAYADFYLSSDMGEIFVEYMQALASCGPALHMLFFTAGGGPGEFRRQTEKTIGAWVLAESQEDLLQEPAASVRGALVDGRLVA